VIAAILVMLGMAGCQVHTEVAIRAAPNGTGTVTVTVTLDHAAVTALGGQAALAAQLQAADLVAAGWAVTGPAAGADSTTVVSASHPFANLSEAGQLVEEVAGSGSAGSRPFAVTLTEQHSFWHTDVVLSGQVDLTCGVNCFGDAGLGRALGSRLGVDPGPLISAAGQQPNQVFSFSLNADLPGTLQSTNAASHQGSTLQWNPQLGHVLVLSASTRTWNRGRIITFIAVGGGLVLVLLGLMVFWLVRRRRRRRRKRGQHVKGNRDQEAVAPRP
jgi:hypothetical protein